MTSCKINCARSHIFYCFFKNLILNDKNPYLKIGWLACQTLIIKIWLLNSDYHTLVFTFTFDCTGVALTIRVSTNSPWCSVQPASLALGA